MIREARKEVLRLETKSPHIYETLDYKRLNKKSFIAVLKDILGEILIAEQVKDHACVR